MARTTFPLTMAASLALVAGANAAKFQIDVQYEGNCSVPVFATVKNDTGTTTCSSATCSVTGLTARMCSDDAGKALASVFGASKLMRLETYRSKGCFDLDATHYLLVDNRNHTVNAAVTVVTTVKTSGGANVTTDEVVAMPFKFEVAMTNSTVSGNFTINQVTGSGFVDHVKQDGRDFEGGVSCTEISVESNRTSYSFYPPEVPKPDTTTNAANTSKNTTGSKGGGTSVSSRESLWLSALIAGASIVASSVW